MYVMRVRPQSEKNGAKSPELFVVYVERFISLAESHPRDVTRLITMHIKQAWESGEMWRALLEVGTPSVCVEDVYVEGK